MDLAAHLGMTVARLTSEMDIRELALWKMKAAEDPWGDIRADLRMGMICSTLANIHRDPKKKPKPFAPSDFPLFKRDDADAEETSSRPRRATIQPETIAWLNLMADKAAKGKPSGH